MDKPKSEIIQEIGWLAPTGDYYPCVYDEPDRESFWHLRKALEITDWFYPDDQVSRYDYDENGPQEFLVGRGWIRVDINHLWFHQRPTKDQVQTLFLLWSKPYQRYLPTEQIRLFLAWQGVDGAAKPDDDYTTFEASVPDGNLTPLTPPRAR